MRRIFVDKAESMLKALATLLISMSGSCASSMMCVATPGGDGKLTSERRCASTSGFTRHAPTNQPDPILSIEVSVRSGRNLSMAPKEAGIASSQARAGPPPLLQALEDRVEAEWSEYDDPGGQRPGLKALVDSLINASDARTLVPPQCL